MRYEDSPEFCGYASANSSCVHKIPALVVPDQERIEYVAVRNVAADHELLAAISPPFEPITRSFAGAVPATGALGDNTFELMLPHGAHQFRKRQSR